MACIKLLLCVLVHLYIATAVRGVSRNLFERSICYDDYGCFNPRPGYLILPDTPQKVNTKFFLYTRNNPTLATPIFSSDLGPLDLTKPLKLIIHGFNDKATNKWIMNITKELLISEDMNVIAVDWSGGNQFPYEQAVANTVIAAVAIRQLLQAIIEKGVQPQQIHLIGHSLGAHISSYVGRSLPNLGRISGLDPAGPSFYDSDTPDRLDASDALFVDVVHTDGAPHMVSGFGYMDTLGHVDFYPNGGSTQPTCPKDTSSTILQSSWELLSTANLENAVDTVACNHMSAVFYYADSINTRSPSYAYPCASYSDFEKGLCTSCGPDGSQCQRAGYHASPDGTLGTLYLMTLSGVKPPHFGFHFEVTLVSAMPKQQQARGTFKIKFNDQDEKITLFDQHMLMKHDSTKSKTIVISKDPSSLEKISISFKKTYDVYYGMGYGYADEWSFRLITVLDMQTNTKYTFCAKSDSSSMIKSGSDSTFELCA